MERGDVPMDGKFSVKIPDIAYWKEMICCQNACPVHTDSRGYVRAIAENDYERAYFIARAPNPLASICGRICGAPCEVDCRRKDLDKAVTIRALKRFVTEQFGPISKDPNQNPIEFVKRFLKKKNDDCEGLEDIKNLLNRTNSLQLSSNAKTVGIIGSGPAGLSAAHDLCLLGIKPVIYEMEPTPAGMLYLGVPEYRLPRELIKAEVEVIKAMGTEIICNTQVGKDITLAELRKKHNAVLIAVGAKKSRTIPIPNINAPGVIGGINFLRDVALNFDIDIGERVIVIGGGNVAYDVARTLIRQTEYDVSRTALRQKGVKQVSLVCLEGISEMPADDVEIMEGQEEGVVLYNSWGPNEILVDKNGKAKGVKFIRCVSVFGENGKFSPKFDSNETMEILADNIFLSIGQASDLSFIDSKDVTLNEFNQLKLNGNQTEAKDVFAAGDITYGPRLMIDAIASGKKAARNIYTFITGKRITSETTFSFEELKEYNRELGYENIKCSNPQKAPALERSKSMSEVVEKNYTQKESLNQGSRCLNCGINTIFDSSKCILCGGCADVCPQTCLSLVSLEHLKGDDTFSEVIKNYLQGNDISQAAAIIKDETICIRCGSCADRCPVGAITMEAFKFKEILNES